MAFSTCVTPLAVTQQTNKQDMWRNRQRMCQTWVNVQDVAESPLMVGKICSSLCALWCFILRHDVNNTKFVANWETFLVCQMSLRCVLIMCPFTTLWNLLTPCNSNQQHRQLDEIDSVYLTCSVHASPSYGSPLETSTTMSTAGRKWSLVDMGWEEKTRRLSTISDERQVTDRWCSGEKIQLMHANWDIAYTSKGYGFIDETWVLQVSKWGAALLCLLWQLGKLLNFWQKSNWMKREFLFFLNKPFCFLF